MRPIRMRFTQVLLLGLMFALFNHQPVMAQGIFAEEIYSEIFSTPQEFRLDVYFNVVDGAGQILTETELESVNITLANGSEGVFQPTQPGTPFYITLVLDISGSMAGRANEAMRSAASQSLQNAPNNAQFSIVTFHSEVATLQPFTGDVALVQAGLSGLQAVNGGGTCLYDAMYNAVKASIPTPKGRRAIIAFTDGVDELRGGDRCSVTPLDTVITEAKNNFIPIYTIGLLGQGQSGAQVNVDELRSVADSTGGFFYSGDQNTLAGLFGSIMKALSSQWYIRAEPLYPDMGEQVAVLKPVLSGGLEIDGELNIRFTAQYDHPTPTNCTVTIDPPTFDEAAGVYNILVKSNDPASISTLDLKVIQQATGTEIKSVSTSINNMVQLPLAELAYSTQYILRAVVTSSNASCPPNTDLPFSTPPEPIPLVGDCTVNLQDIRREGVKLIQPYNISPNSAIESINYAVIDGNGIVVPNIGGTISDPRSVTQMEIPADPLIPQAEYTVRIDLTFRTEVICPDNTLPQISKEFVNPIQLPQLQVASVEDIVCEKPILLNLQWVNQAESATITEITFTLNNASGTKVQEFTSQFQNQISFDYEDLKSKQAYNLMVTVKYDTDTSSPQTLGTTPTYQLHQLTYTPRRTLSCIVWGILSSPFVIIGALVLFLGGSYFFYSQRRTEKDRKSEAFLIDNSRRDHTVLDARFTPSGSYPLPPSAPPPYAPPPLKNPTPRPPMANPTPRPPYNPPPPMEAGLETLNNFPAYQQTEVVNPQMRTLTVETSDQLQDTLGKAPDLRLTVVESKTPPNEIRLSNRHFDVANRTVKFRYKYSIGRENCSLTLDKDKHISREHLLIEYSIKDREAYKITVMGQNKTLFDGVLVERGDHYLLMPHTDVVIEIPDRDGTKVLLEVSYP